MVSLIEEISRSLSFRIEDVVGSTFETRDAVATCCDSSECSHLDIALE